MTSSGYSWLVNRELFLDAKNDSRISSNRNTSVEDAILNPSSRTSSLISLIGTLALVITYCAICLVSFFILRPRCPRVYAPRTLPGLGSARQLSPELPNGIFSWIKPFFETSDTFFLKSCSLDSFFFLRYLKVLRIIFFAGCCITWPVLIPLHVTGGGGIHGLGLLTIANVSYKRRLYAHMIIAITWFSFIITILFRECLYYIDVRLACISSPRHARQLASRTILLTCVPERYLNERCLRRLYGDSVERVWIPRTTRNLAKLVKEREKTALMLEEAEIELIQKANKARRNHLETCPGTSDTQLSISLETNNLEDSHPYGQGPSLPNAEGSVAAQWIPKQARPRHRRWTHFWRLVDTISVTRSRMKDLNAQISKLRRQTRHGKGPALPAAFIAFNTQKNAHAAHQVLTHHIPMQMKSHFHGIRPKEILWQSIGMKWRERIARKLLALCLIVAAIVFWSIPTAAISVASNIEFWSQRVHFFSWIKHLPKGLLRILRGFVAAVALTLWMDLVPALLRFCAIQSGSLSLTEVELFTQKMYFAFLVVQVFLITTLTSTISTVVLEVLRNPLSIKDILATSIPKASDSYYSYILIQCLADGAASIFPILELFRHYVWIRTSSTPRAQYRKWNRLKQIHWGTVFPRVANMGVIGFSYGCIAPLILIFAGIGMWFLEIVYRYKLIYMLDCEMDTTGLFYPRALLHLTIGLYLAEICLIGLFFLSSALIPMAFTALFLVLTGLAHYVLSEAIEPLLHNLPQSLSREEELLGEFNSSPDPASQARNDNMIQDEIITRREIGHGPREDRREIDSVGGTDTASAEGAFDAKSPFCRIMINQMGAKLYQLVHNMSIFISWSKAEKIGLFSGSRKWWLRPDLDEILCLYENTLESSENEAYTEKVIRRTYLPPELWLPKPTLWIPRDEAQVSRQEVTHTKPFTSISDVGATLDEKGRIVTNFEDAPIEEKYWNHPLGEAVESSAPSFLCPATFGL